MRVPDYLLPFTAAATAVTLLAWWLVGASGSDLSLRVPGMDGGPMASAGNSSPGERVVAGFPSEGDGRAANLPGKWTGFRGNHRDGIADDTTGLSRSWAESGPTELWTIEMGEGYAGAVISEGRAFVLDYDESAAADTIRCLAMDDGREIWTNSYPVKLTRNHGLSRTVPVVADDLVITIGPRCHVACWDVATGECRWLIDLVRDHGATVPRWYAGQCPLVADGQLILAPCGTSLLIAVDCKTGAIIWETPNRDGWNMTHSSVMPMNQATEPSYVYCTDEGVVCVAATDGRIIWTNSDWTTTFATCPSPLVLPGGRIFLSSGYGRTVGSLMLEVPPAVSGASAHSSFALSPKQFNSEHHTPIFFRDHIFGVRKHAGGQLVCLDLRGKELWSSGSDRFGHGPYVIVDELILVMDDHGVLSMVEASLDGYQRLGRHEVFADGHDAWGPMAFADGRLVVRDMTRMTCLDLPQR